MGGVPRRTVLGWLLGAPLACWVGRRPAAGGVVSRATVELVGAGGPHYNWVPVAGPAVTAQVTIVPMDGAGIAEILRSADGRAVLAAAVRGRR